MRILFPQLISDTKDLIEKEFDDLILKDYKTVFGISSGGILSGHLVSEALSRPLLTVEEYKNYKNKKEVLIVDDLVDSGKTLAKYPESDWFVIYKKEHYKGRLNYFLKEIPNEWVILPHEKDETGIEEHLERIKEYYHCKGISIIL